MAYFSIGPRRAARFLAAPALALAALAVGQTVALRGLTGEGFGPAGPQAIQNRNRQQTAGNQTFVLETHSTAPYTATYIGNGAMGLSSSVSGTLPTDCFLSGVYEHSPGDVVRIARTPAWNEVDVYNGSAWLNQAAGAGLRAYHQSLDMFNGVLRTGYEWQGNAGAIGVQVESFVSRAQPEIGVLRMELTPQFDGPLRVRLPLRAMPPPHRYPLEKLEKLEKLEGPAVSQQAIWYAGYMAVSRWSGSASGGQGLVQAQSRTEGPPTTLFEAVALQWPKDLESPRVDTLQDTFSRTVQISFNAKAGKTYAFYKYAALLVSFTGDDLHSPAEDRARQAAARGYDALYAENADAWHGLWQSDIVVEGDPALQTAIHSMLYYLLGSARAGSDFSVPPMGLSTAGYYGHFFWDADTFMFPPLMLLHPEIAKSIVMFRSRTLDAARANAKQNGYEGAMYPWEAAPDGAEATPRFAYQNALYENHVNADVALAAWQYYLATGDRAWLEQHGFPIIRDTADFWVSRVSYNPGKDSYEIGKVVSVIESRIGVSDDPYTNAAAKENLELALTAAKTLGLQANPKWAEIAGKLYLPSMDSMLIDYPLEYPLAPDQRRAIARESLSRPPEGVMMGSEFDPILGVELGDRKLIDELLPRTWQPYARPPFNVLTETPTNSNTNFITGAGAFLHQFLFGYSGLRLTANGLEKQYAPLLPSSVRKLTLKQITVRGERQDIAFENGRAE